MSAEEQGRKLDSTGGVFATNPTLFLRINATEPGPREIAWEQFRSRYAPMIAGFARNLGARPQDVDDLI